MMVLQGESAEGKPGPQGNTGDPGDRVWKSCTNIFHAYSNIYSHSSFILAFLFQGPRGPPGEIGSKVKNRINVDFIVACVIQHSECIIYESVDEVLFFYFFLQGDRGQTGAPGLDGAKVSMCLCKI